MIFLTLLITPSLSALGVSPGIVRLNFEPNLSTSFEMTVHNLPAKNQDADIYISLLKLDDDMKEDFSNTFTLEKTRVSFTEQDSTKSLTVFIKFPQAVAKQGTHEIRVGAVPAASGEGAISIRAGNEITVFVAVPPEFATNQASRIEILNILDTIVNDTKKGENSNIDVIVQSKSDAILNDVRAKVKVTQNSKEIETISTNQINLNPNEQGTLTAVFDTSKAEEGMVNLEIEVFFSSKSTTSTKSFNVYTSNNKSFYWIIIILTIFFLLLIIIAIIILLIHLIRKKDDSEPVTEFRKTF